jgi:N-acetyl-1-D-myo-inositol-2-amino-2-deoxy-alpha-D-glucopyranoside deacetylase
MRHLGVSDHRFLGGAGRFRDSGMLGVEANSHPRAFWRGASDADVFAAAVAATVQVIRDVRPQVVVTYDDNGDYGHPDHIMAHRVTTAAVERAAEGGYGSGDPWQVAKFYWTAVPKSLVRAGAESADNPFEAADADDGIDDALVTTVIDAAPYGPAKIAALQAHRTQIAVDGPFFALSNMLGRLALPVEYYRLRSGTMGSDRDADGRENDLFSGVDT